MSQRPVFSEGPRAESGSLESCDQVGGSPGLCLRGLEAVGEHLTQSRVVRGADFYICFCGVFSFLFSKIEVSEWPSGLRRQTQVLSFLITEGSGLRMEAWVRIPLLTRWSFSFSNLFSILTKIMDSLRFAFFLFRLGCFFTRFCCIF